MTTATLTETTLGLIEKTKANRLSRGGWWQLMNMAWQGEEVLDCLTTEEMDELCSAIADEDGEAMRRLAEKVQPELRAATLAGLDRFGG